MKLFYFAPMALLLTACGGGSSPVEQEADKKLGSLPQQVIYPADNQPNEAKIQLGKLLFWDPVLSGDKDVNTWAQWHDFHVLGDSAVCVLSRKHSGMNGQEMKLLCNIEWRFEQGRWQVLREQIFLLPLSQA